VCVLQEWKNQWQLNYINENYFRSVWISVFVGKDWGSYHSDLETSWSGIFFHVYPVVSWYWKWNFLAWHAEPYGWFSTLVC
jgi:hypothetical protein